MNLSSQLHETAGRLGEKPAYYFMNQSSTYAELDAAVTKFASGLEKLGVRQGDHIAMLLGNSPHFLIGLYGALRLGAKVIPVNPLYTAGEIGYILHNGDVKAVIGLDLMLPLAEKMHAKLPSIENYIICPSDKATQQASMLKIFRSTQK